jgi:hypothetical protein
MDFGRDFKTCDSSIKFLQLVFKIEESLIKIDDCMIILLLTWKEEIDLLLTDIIVTVFEVRNLRVLNWTSLGWLFL